MSNQMFETVHLVLAAMWRRRYLIVTPILLMPLFGFIAGKLVPRAYEARMTLLVQEPAKLNPFLNDFAVATNLKDRMAGLQTLVHSEHILGEVVDQLSLASATGTLAEREQIIQRLSTALTVSLIGSDLIDLRLRGERPAGMDRVLAAVGERFIDRLLAPERSSIRDSELFLNRQITEQRSELANAEQALATFKTRNADKLPALYSGNVQRLASLRQTLEEKRTALAGADAAFKDLRARLLSTNPLIARLEDNIVQLRGELTLLRARYTEEHSEVQAASRKLRRLEAEKDNLMDGAKALMDGDVERLLAVGTGGDGTDSRPANLLLSQLKSLQEAQARRVTLSQEVGQLEKAVADLQSAVAAYGPVEQELQGLERAVVARRDIHDALARRHEMARVTGALGRFEGPERVKVIEAPREPVFPVTPGTVLFVAGGVAAGIALGAGLAVLMEMTDMTLRQRHAIEELLRLRILSRIPNIPNDGETVSNLGGEW